jgi:hypothetical protein
VSEAVRGGFAGEASFREAAAASSRSALLLCLLFFFLFTEHGFCSARRGRPFPPRGDLCLSHTHGRIQGTTRGIEGLAPKVVWGSAANSTTCPAPAGHVMPLLGRDQGGTAARVVAFVGCGRRPYWLCQRLFTVAN